MLRIAQLTATFPPYLGGAGTACFHMSVELAERGHHVEVITAEADGEAPDSGKAVVHRARPLFRVGNAPLIPGIASLRDFDVIHLHYPFIFGTELLLASRLRSRAAPLVVSYHNRLIGDRARRPLFWLYEESFGRLLVRHCDRICVVSEAHAETVSHLRRTGLRRPEKLAVLPDGVDTQVFSPGRDRVGFRETNGIPEDAVVAAFVATLDRAHFFKRLDLAIEAIALAPDPRLHILVAGGGECLDRYRRQAAAAGAGERVHFAGPLGHDRLPDLLRAADFLLLTSDLESFGIVLIEAMACGVPTVSTDLPGVRAVVREGSTGLIASRGDPAALASAIGQMIDLGPEGRSRMGLAGREECERAYAWPKVVDRLEQIYFQTLEERRPFSR